MVQIYSEDIGQWSEEDVYKRRFLGTGSISDSGWDFTIGQQAYVDSTPGAFTFTRPTTGHISLIGEATTTTALRFDPSPEQFYEWEVWEGSAIAYDRIRYIYEFGGDPGTGIHNLFRRLDLQTFTWTNLTVGCTARRDAAMIWVQGYLYVYGGQDADGNALSTMCIYSTWTDTWQGPFATPCGTRISPSMLQYYNSETGKWEIHIIGGYDSSGTNSTVCIYTPDDGSGSTPDEGTPPDDVVPDDFHDGDPAPDGFDGDMDWHPPSSDDSDDAYTEVSCLSEYDASLREYPLSGRIGDKLYLFSGTDSTYAIGDEVIEFDLTTGAWQLYSITPPTYGIDFILERSGRLYGLAVYNWGGEVTGRLSLYSWAPGDLVWTDHGSPDPNSGRTAQAFAHHTDDSFTVYYEYEGETKYINFVFNELGGDAWSEDYSTGHLRSFYQYQDMNDSNLYTLGWTLDDYGQFVDPPGGTITGAGGSQTPWPGIPRLVEESIGSYSNDIYLAFGMEVGDTIYDASPNTLVRRYDIIGSQWFAYAGTTGKTVSLSVTPAGKHVFRFGDYLYNFVVKWEEDPLTCSICMWKFDTTWTSGGGVGSYPITVSFLNSSSMQTIFMIKRDPITGTYVIYRYTASADPDVGGYEQLTSLGGQDDWSEIEYKAKILQDLRDQGIATLANLDFYYPPNAGRISVDYSAGEPDPSNPNSIQYVRADASGHLYFQVVPGL